MTNITNKKLGTFPPKEKIKNKKIHSFVHLFPATVSYTHLSTLFIYHESTSSTTRVISIVRKDKTNGL